MARTFSSLAGVCFACFCLSSTSAWADATATLQPAGGGGPIVFDTIQEAVDAAVAGDTILLSADVFTGLGNRDVLIEKNLVITGAGQGETILNCENLGRAFHIVGPNVDQTTVLSGFTVTQGSVFGVIAQGGAILVENASPRFTRLTLANNFAEGQGGAYSHSGGLVDISDSSIHSNTADSGGGIFITLTDGAVTGCVIRDNSVTRVGGGVGISGQGPNGTLFQDCLIRRNDAGMQGGGLYVELVEVAVIERCIIAENTSGGCAGGVSMVGNPFLVEFDVVIIKNSLITRNEAMTSGGGMTLSFLGGAFQNVTMVDNTAIGSGGGVDADSSDGYLFTNSILWGNRSNDPDLLTQQVLAPSLGPLLVDYSNVEGLTPFLSNISEDPLFRNPTIGDYHLMYRSPCRDAGDPFFPIQPGEQDIDNEKRIFGGLVDMGSDEYSFDEIFQYLGSPQQK